MSRKKVKYIAFCLYDVKKSCFTQNHNFTIYVIAIMLSKKFLKEKKLIGRNFLKHITTNVLAECLEQKYKIKKFRIGPVIGPRLVILARGLRANTIIQQSEDL